MEIEAIKPQIAEIARKHKLDLVVLFGSQARGKTHPKSDVDIGYIGPKSFDMNASFKAEGEISHLLKREDVEFVNLRRVSPLMKKVVCDEGAVLYERESGVFTLFKLYALKMYAETKPLRALRYESLKRFIYEPA